jgi:iron(III) transport system ATP-binding protein
VTEVELAGVRKSFGKNAEVRAIDGVNLTIAEGELLVLLGPSGCGKTTLLRCLAGLEQPDEGRITVAGETVFDAAAGIELPVHRRDIGMVFQNYALWPHLTIAENVAYPLRCRRVGRAEREERVAATLDLVQCGHLRDRVAAALSGGQQQRIALARAMVAQPRLMLFDEPLSNLDYRLRAQLREQIRALHRELGFTAVYVTHDQTEALQLGSRIAVLREGRVEQLGDPRSVFATPASPYVAEFLGITNRLELVRSSTGWRSDGLPVRVDVPNRELDPAGALLYVRPTALELCDPDDDLPGAGIRLGDAVVEDVLYDGDQSIWVVERAGNRLRASAPDARWSYRPGDRVDLAVAPGDALLYPTAAPAAAAA